MLGTVSMNLLALAVPLKTQLVGVGCRRKCAGGWLCVGSLGDWLIQGGMVQATIAIICLSVSFRLRVSFLSFFLFCDVRCVVAGALPDVVDMTSGLGYVEQYAQIILHMFCI